MISLYLVQYVLTEYFSFYRDYSIEAAFIGFGESSAVMLDGVLEHAQLPCFCNRDCNPPPICANVFCSSNAARRYLKDRPALEKFFLISLNYDGVVKILNPRLRNAWGVVAFRPLGKNCQSFEVWDAVLPRNLHFAFVSLNNEWNYEVATAVASARRNSAVHVAKQTNLPLDWARVQAMSRVERTLGRNQIAIYPQYNVSDLPRGLIDMAKRVHWLWLKTLPNGSPDHNEIDLTRIENVYYLRASLSFASALSDVLRSLNPKWIMDWLHYRNEEIAYQYQRFVKENPETLDALSMAFHRRSDVHKICRSWGSTNDVALAVRNCSAKNGNRKTHLFIAQSKRESALSDLDKRKYFMSGKASEYEMKTELDDLERMNVKYNVGIAKAYGLSPMKTPIIKENDKFIARNLPFILTGDESMLDETLLWNGF